MSTNNEGTPTPLTDAALKATSGLFRAAAATNGFADHARQLEHSLTATKQRLEEMERENGRIHGRLGRFAAKMISGLSDNLPEDETFEWLEKCIKAKQLEIEQYYQAHQNFDHDILKLLFRCQNGDATCLFTAKIIEAAVEKRVRAALHPSADKAESNEGGEWKMSAPPLTPEQINVLIAESLGWKTKNESGSMGHCTVLITPEGKRKTWDFGHNQPMSAFINGYPNFHGSLDACAMFEATLQPHEERIFDIALGMACYPSYNQYAKNHATAPQRCTAYLKTKGLIK